ncbi:trehalose synthase [Candidatus Koribacter versatilis Ellin345]|uniref:maltose alpha-D-glucosyltransferase n=1 Tax=Koribacter versatilis (strain Ellin345) TaxID=204669 RepID=Q1IRL3_KORVE|nr:maltose alpha-D-glucosyltransferase [Candidatus Koribacter versatilis]ABF40487.1 trehalose synthase [Candidatus Koribacter versatilis Ellin345]
MDLISTQTWFKDAIIYEVHVRAFYDSVTDGIGDFGGITQKLDYLEDLGVTAVWLLPFYPSPLKDDGYDIADYNNVHPSYGSLREFQRFLREAHRRGIRVITELVLNHTSDQHIWFQRSRRAEPGSRWRNFYVWSDTPDRYQDARIIFKDFETSNWTWDPIAKAYFWHRFYSHQPDLNWENPEVREAMFDAMDFWFDMGVDGMRLDAVPYLYEREGTNCENLIETHGALRELRKHLDEKYKDKMLLAEANQWPEDAVAYFGKGDECHMAFHFPLMPRLFMSLRMEDRYPVTDILRLTPPIPETCQWALFLRNHDELTLEMVTDEERDYMYRTYAHDRTARINLGIRRRLAPLLENDRRKIELMNALLFSLPGTPVVYYGDEIGMGDNIYLGDRNGVRTPMQWSADRNAGFSKANPQKLYLPVNIDPEYHYEAVNVESQQNNPHSLLWWMKRVIAQRTQFKAFGRGTLEFLYPSNRKVVAYIRQYEDETILVVANLSRFTQCAELDLSRFNGLAPVEIFGRARFPNITEQPYFFSLGPHAYYWFHLQPREVTHESLTTNAAAPSVPTILVESTADVFAPATRDAFFRLLPAMLVSRPWFQGKSKTIRSLDLGDAIPLPQTGAYVVLLNVDYADGDPETYLTPLSIASGEKADAILRDRPDAVLAKLDDGKRQVLLYAGVYDREFADSLLRAIVKRKRFKGEIGELVAGHTRSFRKAWENQRAGLEPNTQPGERNTVTITYGENFNLKLYRKLDAGPNPDREMEEFLTEETSFTQIPRALGWLEYRRGEEESLEQTTIGLLVGYARNATNGWTYALDTLGIFFERALAIPQNDPRLKDLTDGSVLAMANQPLPPIMGELLGSLADNMRLLGQRTADLHVALASRPDIPTFAPEPFTEFYRHSLYHGMLGQSSRAMDTLRARLRSLPTASQDDAQALINRENELRARLLRLRDTRISGTRIRHHADYQLSNIQYTGSDFLVSNFEGNPERPIGERRIKRSPLRDIASMVRSFHYVSHAVLFDQVPGIVLSRDAYPQLERWATAWYQWVSALFLKGYLERAGTAAFLPRSQEERAVLLESYTLEKALIEIEYELTHRPNWVRIPVHGILEQLH